MAGILPLVDPLADSTEDTAVAASVAGNKISGGVVQLSDPFGRTSVPDIGAIAAPESATALAGGNNVSQTTPSYEEPGTIDSPLQLVNPLVQSAPFRAPFALPTAQPVTEPTPLIGFLANIFSRTAEGIVGSAAAGAADVKGIATGNTNAATTLPFGLDTSRLGLSPTTGTDQVQNSGARLISLFNQYSTASPDTPLLNGAKAIWNGPVNDFLNLTVLGGLAEDTANAALKATVYDPATTKALQQLGLSADQLRTADDPAALLQQTVIEKGNRILGNGAVTPTETGIRITPTDTAVTPEQADQMNQLGQALYDVTHPLHGGLPYDLTDLGTIVQKTARAAVSHVYDYQNGFTAPDLSNPSYTEIAPRAGAPAALPGSVAEAGQAYPLGLSTTRVTRVGGSQEDAGDITPENEPQGATVPAEAEQDWEDNYADQYKDLGDQIATLQQGAKVSAAGAQAAAPQIASLSAQATALEDNFMAKYGVPKGTQGPITVANEPEDTELSTGNTQVEEPTEPRTSSISRSPEPSEQPLADEAAKYKTADEFADAGSTYDLNGIVPEYGTQNQYLATTPKTPAGGIGEEGQLYELKQVLRDKPAYLGTSPNRNPELAQKIRDFARKYGLYITTDKARDGQLIVAKNKIAAEAVINASNGRELGLALGYKDLGRTFDREGLVDFYNKTKGSADLLGGSTKVPGATPTSKKVVSAASRDAEQYGMLSEDESLELLANTSQESEYALYGSGNEEEQLVDNLTEIFAEMQGIKDGDIGIKFSQQELEDARTNYELAMEALLDHPGRALMKYISPQTGELPELGSDTKFGKVGEDIIRSTLGEEVSEGGDINIANEYVEAYKILRNQVVRIQQSLREARKSIRLHKMRDQFVSSYQRLIARQVAKDVEAMTNLVQAAKRAGIREGRESAESELQALIKRLKARRRDIITVQHTYNLTDGQMAAIRGTADPRFMGDDQFAAYLQQINTKAQIENEKNITKQAINAQIDQKNYKNPENLRIALELPALSRMSLEELQAYDKALSVFKQDDEFLGPRMIETIGNTDLGTIKTFREVRAALAEQSNQGVAAFRDIRANEWDKFTPDSNLQQVSPIYKLMVTSLYAKDLENAQILAVLEKKINELAAASRKSRGRGLLDRLIPQDRIVQGWIETPPEDKALYEKTRGMTPAEIEFAQFEKALFQGFRDKLIEKGTLGKWRENYFTHVARSFFERWKADGFIRALWQSWKSLDPRVDFSAVGPTGEVLGLEKFFKFSLPRSGTLEPSENLAKATMAYARAYYKKDALDAIIPKVIASLYAAQRLKVEVPDMPRDPTGENIDGDLKEFVKQWVNNKKGRRLKILAKQGGALDAVFRGLTVLVGGLHVGLNIPLQTVLAFPLAVANFSGLKLSQLVKGRARRFNAAGLLDRQGAKILHKYPGVVGHPALEPLISAASDVGDTLRAGALIIAQAVTYNALGTFFLGSLTNEEYKTGIVSPARQAEIKLEMGRFHALHGGQSVVGSTTEGKMATLFKGWALAYLFTAVHNFRVILRVPFDSKHSGANAAGGAETKKAFRENFKLIVGSIGLYLLFEGLVVNDKDEPLWLQNSISRLELYLTDGFTFFDPEQLVGTLPTYEFVQNLALVTEQLATLQVYKTTKRGSYHKGELRAVGTLKTLFTPGLLKEFEPSTTANTSSASASSGKILPLVRP